MGRVGLRQPVAAEREGGLLLTAPGGQLVEHPIRGQLAVLGEVYGLVEDDEPDVADVRELAPRGSGRGVVVELVGVAQLTPSVPGAQYSGSP